MNKKALGLAGLGAVALVGGSLAYYSHEATLDNPFTTGSYETHFDEQFTPPTENLEPGAKWDKIVGAENTGDYPVLVRVKMDEAWTRKPLKLADGQTDKFTGEGIVGTYKKISSKDAGFSTGEYNSTTKQFIANQPGDDPVPDGSTAQDETTVYKHMGEHITTNSSDDGKWFFHDGYWYWTDILAPKTKTEVLMDYLVLATNLDTGVYETTDEYQIAAKGTDTGKLEENKWAALEIPNTDLNGDGLKDLIDFAMQENIANQLKGNNTLYRRSESALDTTKPGYADSNYTLSINVSFVQATTDAVAAEWGVDINKLFGTDGNDGILKGILRNNQDTTLKDYVPTSVAP